jgi:hypothetical protein
MSSGFLKLWFSPTMTGMKLRMVSLVAFFVAATWSARATAGEQPPPAAKNARILLLPRKMISGDRTTLAVLDVNGRLTPGVTIAFSNGDHVTTNATGRGVFVAPLTLGVLYANIQGRPGRVQTMVIAAPADANTPSVLQAPHFASLSDRFELQGHGFCGDADKNIVQVNGEAALVMASSSESMTVLPPEGLQPGPGDVTVACNQGPSSAARVIFLSLSLEADTSPMQPGQQRTLTVRIVGTHDKVILEAHNLAPEIAELAGGDTAKAISSGGAENVATFPLTGKQRGNVLVSIRLLPWAVRNKT